jgi:hypothetical protein
MTKDDAVLEAAVEANDRERNVTLECTAHDRRIAKGLLRIDGDDTWQLEHEGTPGLQNPDEFSYIGANDGWREMLKDQPAVHHVECRGRKTAEIDGAIHAEATGPLPRFSSRARAIIERATSTPSTVSK